MLHAILCHNGEDVVWSWSSVGDAAAHEKMDFHEGWGRCTDQRAALAATL